MKIKTFRAKTFAEALATVKKEMSESAVILSSEEIGGIRKCVEVTAAVDYDLEECSMGNGESGTEGGDRDPRDAPPDPVLPQHAATPPMEGAAVADLRTELDGLKQAIEGLKNNGYELSLPPKKREAMRFLRSRGVRDEYALRVCEQVRDEADVPLLVSADIRVKRDAQHRKAVLLVGPTGVGKTTTVAKLAARAVKLGKKAAVISLDTYRIGAVEQARIYTRILGIPLAVAANAAELKRGLLKFSETRDVVFIDTAGRNPREERYLAQMAEVCSLDVPHEVHLLMSASADDAFMIDAYRFYRNLPIDYIVFTKVDEAVRFGPLYNMIVTYQKPVSYLTTGQRVPGDIELATVNRVAGLIVQGSENGERRMKESVEC